MTKRSFRAVLFGLILLLVAVVVLPETVDAQTNGFRICNGTDCSACNLVDLANQVINWLIGVLLVLFAFLAAVAGFKLVASGGNPGALKEAKGQAVNAIVGLLIILSAWIIVDTVIRGLGVTDGRSGVFPWSAVQCQTQTVPDYNRFEPAAAGNVVQQYAGQATDPVSASQAQQMLTAAGVTVQQNVQLDGVSTARLQEITRLAQECAAAMGESCGIQVSSGVRQTGNPAGVGAHGTGQAIDLSARYSPIFNRWMQQQSTYSQVQSFGGFSGYRISDSTVCTWEGADRDSANAHWHCAPPTR